MLWLTLLLAPGCATPDSAPVTASATHADVDISALESAIADGAMVIDVRTDGEWRSGHVPGAIHLEMGAATPDAPALREHDRSAPIYVICESGGRSSRVASSLATGGFHAVFNVTGGTGAWRDAGKPLITP